MLKNSRGWPASSPCPFFESCGESNYDEWRGLAVELRRDAIAQLGEAGESKDAIVRWLQKWGKPAGNDAAKAIEKVRMVAEGDPLGGDNLGLRFPRELSFWDQDIWGVDLSLDDYGDITESLGRYIIEGESLIVNAGLQFGEVTEHARDREEDSLIPDLDITVGGGVGLVVGLAAGLGILYYVVRGRA